MSWVSSLAGRAENLLNKFDQSAAQALQKPNSEEDTASVDSKIRRNHKSSTGSVKSLSEKSAPVSDETLRQMSASFIEPRTDAVDKATDSSFPARSSRRRGPQSLPGSSMDPVEVQQRAEIDPPQSSESQRPSSRQDSSSSGNSQTSAQLLPGPEGTEHSPQIQSISTTSNTDDNGQLSSEPHSVMSMSVIESTLREHTSGAPLLTVSTQPGGLNASLGLENQLLKSEIASLNAELGSVMDRLRNSQRDAEASQAQLSKYKQLIMQQEQIIRESETRLSDLKESIQVKDSQVGILKVRLDERDREFEKLSSQFAEVKTERDRVVSDQRDGSSLKDSVIETLNVKLRHFEEELSSERQRHQTAATQWSERHAELEEQQKQLAAQVQDSQRRLQEEKLRANDLSKQLLLARHQVDSLQQDYNDYKEKANLILVNKDRALVALQQSAGGGEGSSTPMAPFPLIDTVALTDYEALRRERDLLREDARQARHNLENMKAEVHELEMQMFSEKETLQDTASRLEEELRAARVRTDDAENEAIRWRQQAQHAHDELQAQTVQFHQRISQRERELDSLRHQVLLKSGSQSNQQTEMEQRFRTLTDTLIQKQTQIEALQTEKTTLTVQHERLQRKYEELQALSSACSGSSRATSSTMLHLGTSESGGRHEGPGDAEDLRRRALPQFMRESHTDTQVTRSMKRAVNTLDVFGLRLGLFLRRYPIARVLFLFYIILLHLWVMFVLMTYRPEVHSDLDSLLDRQNPYPKPQLHEGQSFGVGARAPHEQLRPPQLMPKAPGADDTLGMRLRPKRIQLGNRN